MQDLDLGSLDVPIIRPDMTATQFENRLRQTVPALRRLMTRCMAPLFALGIALFGSRGC